MNTTELENMIRTILADNLTGIATAPGNIQHTIFARVEDAITASYDAYKKYLAEPLALRTRIITALKEECKRTEVKPFALESYS